MECIYGVYIWSVYMECIYGVYIWSVYMECILRVSDSLFIFSVYSLFVVNQLLNTNFFLWVCASSCSLFDYSNTPKEKALDVPSEPATTTLQ